MELALRQKC